MGFVKKLMALTAGAFLAAAFTATAYAQESDVYDLGEIVVTSGQISAPVFTTVDEITAQQIAETGAKTVAEALDYTAGIRMTVGGKDEPDVRIRNFKQSKVLILVDGIPVSTPYYGYLDLNQLPIDNVAKITVTKGLASSLYGANTLGGVINIVTTKPKTGVSYGKLAVRGSENNTMEYKADYNVGGAKRYYSVSASSSESDGFEKADGTARINTDYDKKNASIKYGILGSGNNEYAVSINYTDNEKGLPIQDVASPQKIAMSPYARFTEWKSWTMDLSGQQQLTKMAGLKEKIYYHKFDNTLVNYTDNTFSTIGSNASGNQYISIYDDYTAGLRLISDLAMSKNHTLSLAASITEDSHKSQSATDVPWEEFVTQTTSLAAESNIVLSQRLAFQFGADYDTYIKKDAYALNSSAASVATMLSTAKTNAGANKSALNTQFGISITPDSDNTIRFSIGKKTRFPTMMELYSYSKGNPDLREQKNMLYELGIEHKYSDNLALNFNVFRNNVKDLIDRPGSGVYQNLTNAIIRGFEVGLDGSLGKFSSSVEYTYNSTLVVDPFSSITTTDRIVSDYSPKGVINFDMKYNYAKYLKVNFFGSHVGARYYSLYSGGKNVRQATPLPDYTIMNLGLSGAVNKVIDWKVFVLNLDDKDYQEEYGYPQAGRTYTAELDWNF